MIVSIRFYVSFERSDGVVAMEYDRSPSVFDINRSISDVPVKKNCRAAWSANISSPPRPPEPEVFLRAS